VAYPNNGGKPIFHEFITPIGLLCHASHDRPLLKTNEQTKKPILDEQGLQEAEYRITVAWEKNRIAELQEIISLAKLVQSEAWPGSMVPGAFFALEPFFRDGDDPRFNTKKREYLFGKYYLNFKQKAQASRHPGTGQVIYSGAPGLVGRNNEDILPLDLYSGCKVKASGILFGSEYMGKNFVSSRLNNIQKVSDGERIGNVRPDAKSQFSPLPPEDGAPLRDVL
jgi:hypothetical protein